MAVVVILEVVAITVVVVASKMVIMIKGADEDVD